MQRFHYTTIVILMLAIGCARSLPTDNYAVGPVPATSESGSVTRERVYVESTNWQLGGAWQTRWNVNGQRLHPSERLTDLKQHIPDSLHKRLAETFKKQFAANSKEQDCYKNFAHACLVSLDPDILIITVRSHEPPSTSPHLFSETQTGAPNGRGVEKKYELIDADHITLVYFAGLTCVWSSEM